MPKNICDKEECQQVYKDKEKLKEIKEKNENYWCFHKYMECKEFLANKKKDKKIKINKKIREKKDIYD